MNSKYLFLNRAAMGVQVPQGRAADAAAQGVLVRLPAALRSYTKGRGEVLLQAPDMAALLERLEEAFPGIRDRIVDELGRLRLYVNVFVNEELVRGSPSEVRLAPGDRVYILPSIAGG